MFLPLSPGSVAWSAKTSEAQNAHQSCLLCSKEELEKQSQHIWVLMQCTNALMFLLILFFLISILAL